MKGQVPGVISFSGWQDMEARAGLRKEQGILPAVQKSLTIAGSITTHRKDARLHLQPGVDMW